MDSWMSIILLLVCTLFGIGAFITYFPFTDTTFAPLIALIPLVALGGVVFVAFRD